MPKICLDNPNLSLAVLLARWPQTVSVFLRYRMSCAGCLISPFHTVMDACAEYGLEEEQFMAELRIAVAEGS